MTRRALVLASLLGSAPAFAGAPETTISVVVTNHHDKPVDNASVILDFLGGHQITKLGKRKPIHWEVRTTLKGEAHFPPIPQGTVQLQVIAKGYQTFGKTFDVDEPQRTFEVQLKPPQSQYSAHPPLQPKDQ